MGPACSLCSAFPSRFRRLKGFIEGGQGPVTPRCSRVCWSRLALYICRAFHTQIVELRLPASRPATDWPGPSHTAMH